jgi:hypothetical protein
MWLNKQFQSLLARWRSTKRLTPRRSAVPLFLEPLEDRTLLSITPVFNPAANQVTFDGSLGSTDNLYLRATGGVLAYSTDGSTYHTDLDPGKAGIQTLTLSNQAVVAANVGGTVYLDAMTRAGGTFSSVGPLAIPDCAPGLAKRASRTI